MGRIRFANQLRGFAAIFVAISHLVGVYWALPEVVSAATATPPQLGAAPGIMYYVSFQWFNLGPFGVAIFFLISGLVVPFSVERNTRGGFMLARLLRIYPTYAAVVVIDVAVVTLSSYLWHRPVPFSPAIIAGNVTLLYDLVGQWSIDLVNWTLSVELKFYLLIMLMAPLIRRGSAAGIVLAGCGLCAANLLLEYGVPGARSALPSTPSFTFSSQSLCLIYMLIGTLFNFHLRGRVRTAGLAAGVAALAGLFVATWLVSVWHAQFPMVTATYFYALVLFGLLYAVRRYVPSNRLLDAMAAISFPFYVLHSLLGFTLLRAGMVGFGLSYYPALTGSVGVVVLVSIAVHRWVEMPTQRVGRDLAARLSVRRPRLQTVAPR